MITTRRDLLRVAGLYFVGMGTLGRRVTGAQEEADRLRWFLDAGFGLFVHWGPYSVAEVEASWPIMVPRLAQLVPQPPISEADYRALPARFDPVDFRPREWVRLARQAGMGYVVFTAKHHDGFCMFDAPGTDYKITRTPYGRDALAELAEACAADGMPLGIYYSPPDMHHPGYRDTSRPATENWTGEPERPQWQEYLDTMEEHLRTLLTRYGDVAVVWFDGLFGQSRYDPARFHDLIRSTSPRTLINDRLGAGDFITPEQFFPSGIPIRPATPPAEVTAAAFESALELLTGDRPREEVAALFAAVQRTRFPTALLPSPEAFQPWETCLTLNRTWAYNPRDTAWKSAPELVRTLVEVASRGGNLLLNVGANGLGTFPPEAVERLTAIGRWMQANGDAIRRTTYGPVQGMDGVRSSAGPEGVYLFVVTPPPGGGTSGHHLEIDVFDRPVSSVVLLADGSACPFTLEDGRLIVELRPEATADLVVPVLAVRG